MGISEHPYLPPEKPVNRSRSNSRTGHETIDWFQTGKGISQGWVLSPCFLNLYAVYIMWIAGWMKHKLESSLPGKISITSDMQKTPTLWPNHLRYAEDNTFMAESEELKSLLKKLKEESEKAGLKLNIQKRWWHLVPSFHGKDFTLSPKSLQNVTEAMKLKDACSLEEKLWET